MRKLKTWFTAAVMAAGFGMAQANLFDRGGGMVYDDVLQLTWLKDWGLAAGSSFDDGASNTDGLMSWGNAKAWADDLVFGGYSDWRLPSALNSNGSGPCNGFSCAGSEMGHMYYVNWGLAANTNILFVTGNPSLALFTNVQASDYWSGTESTDSQRAWRFLTYQGLQTQGLKTDGVYAVAVRPGDVAAVAEPSAWALMGLGLTALAAVLRRRR